MIKFYTKIFWRNFLKNKSSVLLNLLGLTLGITCFLFALLFFIYETGYDNFQINKDRIARIVTTTLSGDNETRTALSNSFLAITLPKKFPEISSVVRFKRFDGRAEIRLKDPGKNLALENIYYSDPDVFEVFSYPLLEGERKTCLREPNTIILSRRIAKKLFGERSGINQIVFVNDKILKVTAVADEPPGNTDFKFEALISINSLPKANPGPWVYTYVLFNNVQAMKTFQAKLNIYANEFVNPQFEKEGVSISYRLEPLGTMHFSNNSVYDTPKGNRTTVNIFLATGILILIIAFTNSINLAVVKTFSRSLDVTIQKIFGASKAGLIAQHVMESVIVGLVAIILSIFLIWLFLPEFAVLLNRELSVSDLLNLKILVSIITSLFVLGAGGAVYTAFYLGKVQLADTLRSGTSKGFKMRIVPRLILGFQFFISMGMIVASLVVYRQVKYLKDAPLGFNPKNILVIDLPQGDKASSGDKYLKNKLRSDPDIIKTSLCGANSLPGEYTEVDVFEYEENGIRVKKAVDNIGVDADYLDLLQIPFIKGEDFHSVKDSVSNTDVIVTSSFANRAGWDQPLGEKIVNADETDQVIGVVPDFHFSSLHNPIAPLIIFNEPENPAYMLVKVEEGKSSEVLNRLRTEWKNAFPEFPFYYYFLDQHLLQQYQDEGNLLKLLLSLSLLIVIISCIGLITYTSFIMRITSLEIAIRRVLGASFRNVFNRFNRQFIIILLIAFLTASPVVWILLSKWLNQFSYHVYPNVTDLLVALSAIVLVVTSVILYYAWRSISVNPAKIIREK